MSGVESPEVNVTMKVNITEAAVQQIEAAGRTELRQVSELVNLLATDRHDGEGTHPIRMRVDDHQILRMLNADDKVRLAYEVDGDLATIVAFDLGDGWAHDQGITVEQSPDQIGLIESEGRIHVVSASSEGTGTLEGADLLELIRLRTYGAGGWQERVHELEDLINDPKTDELALQRFFEANPEFLIGDAYERAIPQLFLPLEGQQSLKPDFGLRPHNPNALGDLLDLKLPQVKLMAGIPARRRLTAKVTEAVAQMRTYQRYFDDPKRRESIRERYNTRFYHPSLFVLIGRRTDLDPIELRDAESDFPRLHLITYDDVLERVRSKGSAI
ncbi:Shedu anti-phage system protein SduA domain-containing protein [Kitasatospora sp. NPDC094019]|uniref:Shedu anti-phage system protein SduA domain-containing protein n=1 Tax=Kitasatospora sp. NPDC094019 TaxID=3364091 RepID=UPI0038289656